MHRYAAAACTGVCLADIVQLVVTPWEPGRVGAIAGAVLYAVLAWGLASNRTWAAVGAVVTPLLPLTLITLWATGIASPKTPDGWMLGIFVVQLVAAALSVAVLRREPLPRS